MYSNSESIVIPEPDEKTPLLSSGSHNRNTEAQNKEDNEVSAHHKDEPSGPRRLCFMLFENFVTIYRGWSSYIKQDIVLAGFSLSFLYMTVLGFDNVTTGQCCSYSYFSCTFTLCMEQSRSSMHLLGCLSASLQSNIRLINPGCPSS
jgi:hypothetical protein